MNIYQIKQFLKARKAAAQKRVPEEPAVEVPEEPAVEVPEEKLKKSDLWKLLEEKGLQGELQYHSTTAKEMKAILDGAEA